MMAARPASNASVGKRNSARDGNQKVDLGMALGSSLI
jgi:hypothetical protein